MTGSGSLPRCEDIPFTVISAAPAKLHHAPICGGVCLPKGSLFEAGEWLVEGFGGSYLVAQTEVLNRWSDGSVRWLLTRFAPSRILPGKTSGTLVRPEKGAKNANGITTLQQDKGELTLSLRQPHNASDTTLKLTPELRGQNGQSLNLHITSISEEMQGDVCCIFLANVEVIDVPFVNIQIRIEVWPTGDVVRVHSRIRNTRRAQHKGGLWDLGDAGSFHFRGLHLNIQSGNVSGGQLFWKAEVDSETRHGNSSDGLKILQQGSGSAAWKNTNHVDADNRSTVRTRGYHVQSSAGVFHGDRCSPTVCLVTEDVQLTVAVPEFWQQFPGSLSVNANGICVGLFPATIEQVFELQGGEQKTQSVCISTRFTGGQLGHLNWTYDEPRMVQSTEWVKQANAMAWLPDSTGFADDTLGRYRRYIHESTSGQFSVAARRAKIDEFGWRNFGDIPADHEQAHYAGSNTIISHYNNQFDLIFGAIQNLVITGDPAWFEIFEPMARHIMDIDIYHTNEDRACFNGGLFWHTDHYVDARTATHRTYSKHNASEKDGYGGGPSNEHNYTTGLMYYYFLTGNPEARASVVSLADWVINMDDGSQTVFGLFDSGDTGLASSTVFEDFHGPGRGVGNSINALLDGWILTRDDRYLSKAEQLIQRSVSPLQNCETLHLADAEGHWSYTVCMTALGRYLSEKLEAGQLDENYDYVRQTLANYGQWMADNEKPTLSEPESLEYPTEAWAAQDIRKANALRIAASCTDDTTAECRMRQKADDLNDAAWRDLYSFGEQHLTARCLSILMTEGLRDVFHRTCQPEYMPPAKVQCKPLAWTMFVPQKLRVKKMLKNPITAVLAATRLLNPQRVLNTVKALRRQL